MSRRIRRLQRHHRQRARAVHLNIVPLIDVFAVLVFFLLVTASLAAARLNIISLNLPAPDRTVTQAPPQEPLTLVLRADAIEVAAPNGVRRRLANTPDGYNTQALAEVLVEAKKAFPKEQAVTILLEPAVAYDELVKVMDVARLTPAEARNAGLPRELFPQISIGDAPADAGPASGGLSP